MDADNIVNDEKAADLWAIYRLDKSIQFRNSLFNFYSPWLKKVVLSFFGKGYSTIEWGDCMQNAAISLIESIERYDFSYGVPFEGYAYIRIRGSLLNAQNKIKPTISLDLVEQHPSDLNSDLGEIDFDYFLDSVISVAFSQLLDMGAGRSGISNDPMEIHILFSEEHKIVSLIDKLEGNQKFVISSHYQYQMKFTQIAELIGVSKSRVSQIHAEALEKLRLIYESV